MVYALDVQDMRRTIGMSFGLGFALAGCSLLGVDDLQTGAASTAGGSGGDESASTSATSATSATSSTSSGGGAGSGGEGAGDATPSSSGAGGTGGGGAATCPTGMVLASSDELGVAFCIDATEVTEAQYLAFLLEVGDPTAIEQPPACADNLELTNAAPACSGFDAGTELPVRCIDWCDAYAYCAWAGKRLCGRIGGTSLTPLDASLTQEEWNFACTAGLAQSYPYGDAAQPGACNIPEENTPDDDSDDATEAPVGSFSGCEGGFDGIFDMQGNVAEWVDWCGLDSEGNDVCRVRGGHTYGTAEYWSCDNLEETHLRLDDEVREVGTRCCADI